MSLVVSDIRLQLARDLVLLDNVSFAVEPGEILAIVGPNGAGKTSLMRVLMAELEPEKGKVLLDNAALAQLPLNVRARRMAMLSQHSLLGFPYTAEEVVELGRIPHSTGRDRDRVIVSRLMDQLDIAHLKQRLYPSLSGGEKQRVQLARVMAQIEADGKGGDSRWLLLDEPSSALDPGHQRQLIRAVRQLADSGVGVVMIMHDVSLAAQCADRLLALSAGQAVACGRPEDVLTEALMQELYQVDARIISHPDNGKPVVLTGSL